jgi:hypothetical protein
MTITVVGPISVLQFREDFPEFRDPSVYADSQVALYANLAAKLFDARRWADLLDLGIELYTAHNLVLDALAVKSARNGGIPGTAGGILSSKSVGSASVSYDTGAGTEDGAGSYNLTIYGRRLWRLIRLAGMAPTQVTGADLPGTIRPGLY